MNASQFEASTTYDNAFLVFVDAAGYSNVVRANPRDRAGEAFDLLAERLTRRVEKGASKHRCQRAGLWSWRGDGGFFVVHDDDESKARDVVLEAVRDLLTLDLAHLQDEFRSVGVRGELHIRVAVHKGTIRYLADGREGSIHSPDINFAAHLEKATPRDTVAISDDVYRVAGKYADEYDRVGTFEGRDVYLLGASKESAGTGHAWLATHGLGGAVAVHSHHERPSQLEKSRLIDSATADIVDLGTTLNTCSNYLMPTERPATYRKAVLDFLERGGTFRGVIMDPDSEATRVLSAQRNEDIGSRIRRSLDRFAQFKSKYGGRAENLHVYQTEAYPGLASMVVDLHLPSALLLYSPYLAALPWRDKQVERGDMPHHLLTPAAGPLFDNTLAFVREIVDRAVRVV